MPDSLSQLKKDVVACRLCPRLVEFRQEVARVKRAAYRDFTYWGKPVPGFGDAQAKLLIVGLAPGAHGANRTGRMFTGDSSAKFLMTGLHEFGFASKDDSISADDGLEFYDCYMTAVARCVPPANKPLPEEIANCSKYLIREMNLLKGVKATLALGKIAMDGYLKVLADSGYQIGRPEFAHGAEYELPDGLPRLFVSYHPSQQNTQTGKLTRQMFAKVIGRIRQFVDHGR